MKSSSFSPPAVWILYMSPKELKSELCFRPKSLYSYIFMQVPCNRAKGILTILFEHITITNSLFKRPPSSLICELIQGWQMLGVIISYFSTSPQSFGCQPTKHICFASVALKNFPRLAWASHMWGWYLCDGLCVCELGSCKRFSRGSLFRPLALQRLAEQEPEQDWMNPTGSLSALFFEDDWLIKHTHSLFFLFCCSLMLAATAALYLPPQSYPLVLSKHQCSIARSLWLIYRQCHPGEQRSLTSQSSSVAE